MKEQQPRPGSLTILGPDRQELSPLDLIEGTVFGRLPLERLPLERLPQGDAPKCACIHPDARDCLLARYHLSDDDEPDPDEECACVCHHDDQLEDLD